MTRKWAHQQHYTMGFSLTNSRGGAHSLGCPFESENRPRPIPPITAHDSGRASVLLYHAHWAALSRLVSVGRNQDRTTLGRLAKHKTLLALNKLEACETRK
ncbi:hypothetical protein EVAR_89951_1 [Eumeta japonica]|uniref:Uncharacterized protein n=1 Tax=Eumeta variegata TaxID=151549 RepID=A0A4C2ACK8_EUMVA|nr:hypothetical protein EVAR_89951_1 [Eumeta japonica]